MFTSSIQEKGGTLRITMDTHAATLKELAKRSTD